MAKLISKNKIKKPSLSVHLKIKRALENDKYKYRTLKGISRDAGVSVEVVKRDIASHSDSIVTLTRRNQNGEALYTTRSHYRKKASVGEKIMGALINRVY